MYTISGVTAGGGDRGQGSRVPPKAFHREIFVDLQEGLQGKERQGKKRENREEMQENILKLIG